MKNICFKHFIIRSLLCVSILGLSACDSDSPTAIETPFINERVGESVTESEADPETNPGAEKDLEANPDTETDLETNPATGTDLETNPVTETDLETNPATGTDLETNPGTETDPETNPSTETEPEIDLCSIDFNKLNVNDTVNVACDFDLQSNTFNFPEGISLIYDGGSIKNATFNFAEGYVDGKLLNKSLTIEGNAQLTNTSFHFDKNQWDIIEGKISQRRAAENTLVINQVISKVHELGADHFILDNIDAYFYGGLGEREEGDPGALAGSYIGHDYQGVIADAILLPSDFHFDMSETTTTLRVQPSNHPSDRLIGVVHQSNVKITGGQLIGDRLEHDYTCVEDKTGLAKFTHEGAALIALYGAHNVTIDYVKGKNSTGDVISAHSSAMRHIDGSLKEGVRQNENITISNSIFDASRRNHISLTDGEGFTVEYNTFLNAGHGMVATAPVFKRVINGNYRPSCEFELDLNGNKIPTLDADNNQIDREIASSAGTLPKAGMDLESYRERTKEGELHEYERIRDVTIYKNKFIGNSRDLILYSTSDVEITENEFGSSVNLTAAAFDVLINENIFKKEAYLESKNQLLNAIQVATTVIKPTGENLIYNVEIYKNKIYDYDKALLIGGKNVEVHGNEVFNTNIAFFLTNSEDNHFHDNIVTTTNKNWPSSTGYYTSTSPTIKNTLIERDIISVNYRPLALYGLNSKQDIVDDTQVIFDDVDFSSSSPNGELWIESSKNITIQNSHINTKKTDNFNNSSVNMIMNTRN